MQKTATACLALQDATAESEEFDAFVLGTYKRWSASAVECYLRDGRCDGCYYQRFFADKPYECRMKLAVGQLLETLGEPRPHLVERVPS